MSHVEEGVSIVDYCLRGVYSGVRVSCMASTASTGGGMEFLCLAVAWPDVFFSSEDLNWTGTPAGDSAIISRAGALVPALLPPPARTAKPIYCPVLVLWFYKCRFIWASSFPVLVFEDDYSLIWKLGSVYGTGLFENRSNWSGKPRLGPNVCQIAVAMFGHSV